MTGIGSNKVKISQYAVILRDISFLAAFISGILSFLGFILWQAFGPSIIASAGIATLASVHEAKTAIDELSQRVNMLGTPGGVIEEVPGFTYVVEPVSVDDTSILIRMIASRRPEFEQCTLQSIVMVFVGEDNIRRAVEVDQDIHAQIDNTCARI